MSDSSMTKRELARYSIGARTNGTSDHGPPASGPPSPIDVRSSRHFQSGTPKEATVP
ncbi:hypothetical protein CHELA17_50024 [Chelatococcus asaccharovorans]|nr:hypothetical protein CHELA17_50024 [Chelatococcus asaccharovorans]